VTSTQQPERSAINRARAIALWARDSGLGSFGFALVLGVALSGWSASFIGLHDFGVHHMHLSNGAAWLVPATFDGAPAGLSIVVMRAGIHGRSALLWRLLIVAFTVLSSWINYEHINDPVGRIVASFMPPSAVILFEGLMSEVRAAAHRRDGRTIRPRLHPLRFVFDWSGTIDIIRSYVLGLPLPETLSVAVAEALSERPTVAAVPAMKAPRKDATERPAVAPQSAMADATQSALDAIGSATEGATVAPRKRPESAPKAATKATRKAPSERPKNDIRGAARDAIKALYTEHGKRPIESQMIAALKQAKLPHSRQFANARRLEIEKEDPSLAALGQDNVRSLTGTDS
jgi:hypothetical protein